MPFEKSSARRSALQRFEAFKIWDGGTQAVNAFFRILPLETPRFWPSAR